MTQIQQIMKIAASASMTQDSSSPVIDVLSTRPDLKSRPIKNTNEVAVNDKCCSM
jgi:hypothetical protein